MRQIFAWLSSLPGTSDDCGHYNTGAADLSGTDKAFIFKLTPQCIGTVKLQLMVAFTDGGLE